jgi:hypothetical protein
MLVGGGIVAETQRALEAAPADSELAGSVRWLRANPILAAGVLLIAAQLWWKAGLLGRSFFRLDDYIYLEHASSSGLTWSYLTWVDAGHLDVVGAAIVWALTKISPEDWTLASAATLVLLGCTCFALLRMLRTLFGDRPGILLLLSLYLLSPLSLPGLSWWTVTLEQLPLQLATFCAVAAHVRYLRTREFRHAVATAAWLTLAMLSSFQGAAVPFLLFAMTSAFFANGAWSRSLWPALREHWRAWGLYIALVAVYAALYVLRLRTSSATPTRPPTFADTLTYAGTLLRDTFVPGMFGGPWRWVASGVEALADPPAPLAWASWVLAVIVVLASLMYGWRAWRAWAILAGWLIVVDVVPVLAGRSNLVSGLVLGLSARYVWDATGIGVLCVGLAFMPLVGGPGPRSMPRRLSRPEFAAATAAVVAIVFGSLWSFYDYPADPTAAAGASYIATARLALADAPSGTVIVDDPTPVDVTGGFFGPVTDVSSVLSSLMSGSPGSRPVFVAQPDGTYDHLMEFDGFGRLVPSVVYGDVSPPVPAGGSCWPASFGNVVVPLTTVATGASTLRIGYLAASPARVLVTFGGRSTLYSVERGLHAVFFPVSGESAGTVVIQQVTGAIPCIGDAQAGLLLPSEAGPAIPPLAVAG